MKKFFNNVKEKCIAWAADIAAIRGEMFDRHPFLLGFNDGVWLCYLFFVIVGMIAKRKGKAWGLVDKV